MLVVQSHERDSLARLVVALADTGGDLAVVDRVLETISQRTSAHRAAAVEVMCAVASQRSGREHRTLEDVAGWILGLPGGASLARMLLDAPVDDEWLAAAVILLVARRLVKPEGPTPSFAFEDAKVESIDRFLVDHWKRSRAKSPHEWLYHPRRTSISGLVVRKFIADLIAVSPKLAADAEAGRLACDLNVEFSVGGRNKTLDCVLGRPLETLGDAIDPQHPLRKARVDRPLITVEVKACMTSHRQANSRLIDELHSSVEVVKAHSRLVIPVAIVIVNVSPTFTNPLNLPGPNKHVPAEVARVFHRLVERVQLDRGSGLDPAYGGLAIVGVDTDNEKRIREATREGRVPASHTYERTVGRVAALYDRVAAM